MGKLSDGFPFHIDDDGGPLCYSCNEMFVRELGHICKWCLDEAPFVGSKGPEQAGVLIDKQFYCMDCASLWNGIYKQTPVQRNVLGMYSQMCSCCHEVIVKGDMPRSLFPCDPNKKKRVIGV